MLINILSKLDAVYVLAERAHPGMWLPYCIGINLYKYALGEVGGARGAELSRKLVQLYIRAPRFKAHLEPDPR